MRENAQKFLAGTPRVHLIDPLSADERHKLMARCYMVMTDSGGLQEDCLLYTSVNVAAIRRHGVLPVGKAADDGKERVKHRKAEDQELSLIHI